MAGAPWEPGTIQFVSLDTKGLVDLDTPVLRYWREFAVEGMGAITVAQVASHAAALPGLDDERAVSRRVAAVLLYLAEAPSS